MQGRTEAHTDADSDASNVLIKYLVPPPVQKEFIEVFQSVKEGRYCSSVLFSWPLVLANVFLTRMLPVSHSEKMDTLHSDLYFWFLCCVTYD